MERIEYASLVAALSVVVALLLAFRRNASNGVDDATRTRLQQSLHQAHIRQGLGSQRGCPVCMHQGGR
jgi:hypothetical protein